MTPNMTQICFRSIGICLFLAALFGYEIFRKNHHHHHQYKIISLNMLKGQAHIVGLSEAAKSSK